MATWAGLLVLTYFVLLGEASQLNPPPILRIVNAAAAGTFIVAYLWMAPRRADRIDRGILVALLFFAGAAVLAQFPRQAFDALLAALLYSAGFFVARLLLGSDAGRRGFALCLMAMSALLTFGAAVWLLLFVEWWGLSGWAVFPPLSLNYSGYLWGHRHDLTLLIVLLYPSWLLLRLTPMRAALATVVGILALLLVLVSGSRNLWLAMGVASAVLGLAFGRRHWPSGRRRQVAVAFALIALVAALALSGIMGLILERAFATESVGYRWAMWLPLSDAWLSKPLEGFGPGAFPWVLQETDYFRMNSWAPRHPDSSAFQLITETGVLGVAAVTVLAVTLVPAIARGRSRAAIWVLTVFVAAGFGANPTDFAFLVAVAISWAAYATPHSPPTVQPIDADADPARQPSRRRRPIRLVTLAAFAIVAAAWAAASIADISHYEARAATRNGRLSDAAAFLEVAGALDPGMALYPRALGATQLLQGEVPMAIRQLTEATTRNPSDDLAWRTLALAYEAAGNPESARIALGRALMAQRSDPTNLLLLARSQLESDRREDAVATLAEVVQAWPEIVAAPGWAALLPPGTSTAQVVELALDRWTRGAPSPEPLILQRITLAAMAGRDDLTAQWAEERLGPSLGPMYVAVMTCQAEAPSLLEEAPDDVRRSSIYWQLVARQAALEGHPDPRATRLVEIMVGAPPAQDLLDRTLNPLEENGTFSADRWGYRRSSFEWPDYRVLPSVEAGFARWYADPSGAIRAAGLDGTMTECR